MGRRTHYTHILLDAGPFVLYSSAAKKNLAGLLTRCPVLWAALFALPGRSVLAGGSGSTAAYASHTRFAMQECRFILLHDNF